MSANRPAAAAQGKQDYRGLQALRAVAALTVVAGHSTDFLLRANGMIPALFRMVHGPAGVDIFFVISGFVMTISSQRLLTKPQPARLFLVRRVIRIVPLYWLLTVAKFAITTLRPALSVRGRPVGAELLWSLLFIPYLSSDGSTHPLIPVGWTLSFEMLFYGIFAAALAVRGGLRWLLGPAVLGVAALGMSRGPGWPVWTTLLDPIVLEFLVGCAIAVLAMEHALPRRLFAWIFVLSGTLILLLTVPLNAPAIARPATWGVGASALVLGTVALESVVGPRLPQWVLLLGDASYSIYLVQSFVFPVLHGALDWMAPDLVHRRPTEAGAAMLVSGVVCTAVVGVLTYRLIEAPMTEALRRRTGAQRPEPVAP